MKITFKQKINIAPLSAVQIQKLRDYEKEVGVIVVAYKKSKEDK